MSFYLSWTTHTHAIPPLCAAKKSRLVTGLVTVDVVRDRAEDEGVRVERPDVLVCLSRTRVFEWREAVAGHRRVARRFKRFQVAVHHHLLLAAAQQIGAAGRAVETRAMAAEEHAARVAQDAVAAFARAALLRTDLKIPLQSGRRAREVAAARELTAA